MSIALGGGDDLLDGVLSLFGRPRWMDRGACRLPPDATEEERRRHVALFYPERGGADEAAIAKAYCAACPVRAECAAFALSRHDREGVWGGTAEKDRRVMLQAWGRGEPAEAPPLVAPTASPLLRRPKRRRPFGCGKGCAECRSKVVENAQAAPLVLAPPEGWAV